jgi:hypothetical protein
MVVSQAVATPTMATPRPTTRHSISVLATYSGNTVVTRCDQVAPVPPLKMLASTLATGSPTRAATDSGNGEQGIETQADHGLSDK